MSLLLGADKKNLLAFFRDITNKAVSSPEVTNRLLQVDNVDPVTSPENIRLHLGVPATGLVTEMNAGLQQLFHSDL